MTFGRRVPPAASIHDATDTRCTCFHPPSPLQDDMPVEDFWKEISILRTCRHDNNVQFKVGSAAGCLHPPYAALLCWPCHHQNTMQ